MTENTAPSNPVLGISRHSFISFAIIFVPAMLGAACALALVSSGPEVLAASLRSRAEDYAATFRLKYSIADAFLTAIMLSRTDIALCFSAILFPYTAAARSLTALSSFLKLLLAVMAFSTSIFSPLSAISMVLGAAACMAALVREETLYELQRSQSKTGFHGCGKLILHSSAASGALILLRTTLLLIGSLLVAA